MTAFQRAEYLFDEAERASEAEKKAQLAHRDAEAEQYYQRAHECRQQANRLLDQVTGPGVRVAG